MKPKYQISADGGDITEKIASRLLTLNIKDSAGFKNDRMELTLDNREPFVSPPPPKTKFTVSMGYEDRMVEMGTYILDEWEIEGPPHTMKITAHAHDTSEKFKASKNRSFHDTTVKKAVEKIAKDHGLEPMVEDAIGAFKIEHRDQTNQSDMAFLTHLAHEMGGIMKVADGKLIVAPRNMAKSVSGKEKPTVTINFKDVTQWTFGHQSRGDYSGVKAKYHDKKKAEEFYAEEGDGEENPYTIAELFPDEETATKAAKSKMDNMKRAKETFSCTVVGNPDLMAESNAILVGFPPDVTTDWLLSDVDHVMGNDGYTTKCKFEVPKTEGDGKSGKKGKSSGGGGKKEKRDNVEGSSGSSSKPTGNDAGSGGTPPGWIPMPGLA